MIIKRRSPVDGIVRERDLDITEEQIKAYLGGALIQEAFPHLSASDREFILTGMTDEQWDEVTLNPEDREES